MLQTDNAEGPRAVWIPQEERAGRDGVRWMGRGGMKRKPHESRDTVFLLCLCVFWSSNSDWHGINA